MSRTSCLKSYLYSTSFLPSVWNSSGLLARVADADVIDRLDDARAEEVGPDAVGDAGGEVRIVGRGQPLGQRPRGGPCRRCPGAAPPRNLGGMLRPPTGCRTSPPPRSKTIELAIVLALLAADLGEERGEAVVVVHRPAVERMVVALGALRADAEEDLGDVLGRLQRVALDLKIVRGRILERAAGGRKQLARPSCRAARCWRSGRSATCNTGTPTWC